MSGIEHIMYRYGPNSGFANVSHFAEGTRLETSAGTLIPHFGPAWLLRPA
jgi:hypothetical protein